MGNLLGTPETKRRGLRTRNALNALTSKPSICRVDRIVLTTLKKRKKKLRDLCYLSLFSTNILLPNIFSLYRNDISVRPEPNYWQDNFCAVLCSMLCSIITNMTSDQRPASRITAFCLLSRESRSISLLWNSDINIAPWPDSHYRKFSISY